MKLFILFILVISLYFSSEKTLPLTCKCEIYCHGLLLHTIQMAKIYKDAKTFVDMKMKFSSNEILTNFNTLMENSQNNPSRNELIKFLKDNFDEVTDELENWTPSDWIENPKFINDKIKDKNYKKWAIALNHMWFHLGRKIKKDVKNNQKQYSLIWVPNPVIVPGGRFREFYYWDSYWIILGLLHTEMYQTAKGMLENFIYMVNKYGLVPNGGRIYYLTRSQPPMLIPMVKIYMDATKDQSFIKSNIKTLDKEFNFWMENYKTTVTLENVNYTLASYRGGSKGPRPESYWNDVEAGESLKNDEDKEKFYLELKAAAESGWDFSTRWFIKDGGNEGKLIDTKIRSIIPVDLNAILYWNMAILEDFYRQLDDTKSEKYAKLKSSWLLALKKVLWHEDLGIWLDYDFFNSKRRNYFYPSNLFPLWTKCFEKTKIESISKKVLKYLNKNKVLLDGGIPTSLKKSGQQWDYPNAWPPLQHMMIVALDETGQEEAKKYAKELAKKWVNSNYLSYKNTEAMYEKYDAMVVSHQGQGGEYDVQMGFGWTNGVILDLLYRYGNEFSANDTNGKKSLRFCRTLLLILCFLNILFK